MRPYSSPLSAIFCSSQQALLSYGWGNGPLTHSDGLDNTTRSTVAGFAGASAISATPITATSTDPSLVAARIHHRPILRAERKKICHSWSPWRPDRGGEPALSEPVATGESNEDLLFTRSKIIWVPHVSPLGMGFSNPTSTNSINTIAFPGPTAIRSERGVL